MRYGMIGRSGLDNLLEDFEGHVRVFRAFGVPTASYYNSDHGPITSGPLRDHNVARYFSKFNIEKILKESTCDVLFLDTYKDVKNGLIILEGGNVIPNDSDLFQPISEKSIKDSYGTVEIGDFRFFEAIHQNLIRFGDLVNSTYPDMKVIIFEGYATNTFLDSSTGVSEFMNFVRYGSELDYFNTSNYRMSIGVFVGRVLNQQISNSAIVKAPITIQSQPPFAISPTHYSKDDYRKTLSQIEERLNSDLRVLPKESTDLLLYIHSVQSHNSLMSLTEWMNGEVASLRKDVDLLRDDISTLIEVLKSKESEGIRKGQS